MESDNAYEDEEDNVKASCLENSPRTSVGVEKVENIFRKVGSSQENDQEPLNHKVDERSDSDSEILSRTPNDDVNVKNEKDSDSEIPKDVKLTLDKVEKGSNLDSTSLNQINQTTNNIFDVNKENNSDTKSPNDVEGTLDKVERGSDSDSENRHLNKATDGFLDVRKKSGSDSERSDNVRTRSDQVVVESRSDSESPTVIMQTKDKSLVGYSESENPNSEQMTSDKIEMGIESDLKNSNESTSQTDAGRVVKGESDSDIESPNNYTAHKGHVGMKSSYSEAESADNVTKTSFDVENKNDSESEINNVNKAKERSHVIDKDLDLDSENISINRHSNGKEEEGSYSDEDKNKIMHNTEKVHIVEEVCGSDSGSPTQNKNHTFHVHEKSDSESESNKEGEITKDVFVEEKEIGLSSENNNIVSQIVEIKEVDPVFDGTESLIIDTKMVSSSSDNQISGNLDSPSTKAWPAIKNLVKIKDAIAVSNVFRRLSGGKDGEKDGVGPPTEEEEEEEKNVIVEGTDKESIMKGRIILYTRLGCQESRKIRAFLHKKELNITEINVDIFPGRKLELEKNTGSSAVPRLYINDYVVGGLRELMEMVGTGKFEEQIELVKNCEPSPNAPLPPHPGEDDVSSTGKIDELASIVKKMKESITISDRFYKLRRFNSCFVGSEAVDFLSRDQDLERGEAIKLGRKLVKGFFFRHIMDENIFEDGNHLYRFLEHDPSISTNCFNMSRGINELKPKRVTEIASRLRFLSFAIFESYATEDGRHVDYKSIQNCEEFRRYLRIIQELQRVDMDNISREEKLAFFINLYNMMAIHAILTWGYPNGAADRKKLLGEFKYVVGGSPYSLSAIQNGILRGNQRPPYNLSKPFGPKDPRFKVALPYAEPLIHFALVCGTKSGPALRCYSPGDIDMELMESARVFLRGGGLIVDAETKTASASSIIKWYSVDFGKNDTEIMKHLSNYLEPSKSQKLLDLLADNQLRVTYQPYDWGCNC